MRVLILAKDFPAPGEPNDGIFVLRQAQALRELGHELKVVRVVPHAPPWTPKWRRYRAIPHRYAVENVAVESLRAIVPPRMLAMEYLPLLAGTALRRLISEFSPDIVHAHFLIPCGQLAVRQGAPTIVTAHGSDAYDWPWRRPGLRRAAAQAIARAGAVVAVSDFIARRVRAIADRHVHVVFNGADERIFTPSDRVAARAALGIAPDRFVVAFTGRPTPEKGFFDLLEAVSRLRMGRALLVVAGALREDTGRSVAARNLDAVLFGELDHPALARVLAAANVFALPSYREGLPVSICEAMLAGRPVVATPVGGIPEIVTDGVRGYLVGPGDVSLLAQRLRAIAEDPGLGTQMGVAAHRFAIAHLTWRVNARRYDRLYDAVRCYRPLRAAG